jgi:mono/diheme cytochrome c family protein
MSCANGRTAGLFTKFASGLCVVAATVVLIGHEYPAEAQEAKKSSTAQAPAGGSAVSRGQYIVEDVAMCGQCHTPRLPNGSPDRGRWLAGAPVPYQPSQPTANWPMVAPRIAGQTPTSVEGMIILLTTGIWTDGKPLRDPMPKFHMTKADAEAVVAYLKSLTPGR